MMFLLLLPSVSSSRAKLLLPALVLWMTLEFLVAAAAAAPVAFPGCPETCGSVTVPYPFGFRRGCFHAGFNLTCDETHHPPKLLLGDDVQVDSISLAGRTMRVQSKAMVMNISSSQGNQTAPTDTTGSRRPPINSTGSWYGGPRGTGMQLSVSTDHNIFVAVGCNFIAYLVANPDNSSGPQPQYVSACAALCESTVPTQGGAIMLHLRKKLTGKAYGLTWPRVSPVSQPTILSPVRLTKWPVITVGKTETTAPSSFGLAP